MIRVLFKVLVVGLVVSCAMEEPDTSGALSLDPNYGEPPEGISIQDVDIIKDGFIDMKDLVAVAHFYQQEVPDNVAKTSDTTLDTDESAPCRNLESRFPEMDRVTDNLNYRQIFELEGKKYIYALFGLRRHWTTVNIISDKSIQNKKLFPSCAAVRFLLNDNHIPISVKVKPVAGNQFSQTITSPPFELNKYFHTTSKRYVREGEVGSQPIRHTVYHSSIQMGGGHFLWQVIVHKDYDFNYAFDNDKLHAKAGVPIGDNSVIVFFMMNLVKNKMGSHQWSIRLTRDRFDFRDPFYSGSAGGVEGVYVDMSPTEVRRRYFPEDIDE